MQYIVGRYIASAEEPGAPETPDLVDESDAAPEGLQPGDRDTWWQEPTE
jgi:hypothetical protein